MLQVAVGGFTVKTQRSCAPSKRERRGNYATISAQDLDLLCDLTFESVFSQFCLNLEPQPARRTQPEAGEDK